MSESKHTPEPWTVNPYLAQIAADDLDVPVCAMLWPTDLRSEDETFANARRIVACINACTGIPTEALEAGVVVEMVEVLKELRSAAFRFREEVYRENPTLRISNESTNLLGAFLHTADCTIAEAEGRA